MKHLDIILIGKVQRIGLRYQIKERAADLGLCGYARNLRDGSVFIEVEGNEPMLDKFTSWLKSNPGMSEIKNLEVNEGIVNNYREFRVF